MSERMARRASGREGSATARARSCGASCRRHGRSADPAWCAWCARRSFSPTASTSWACGPA